ncbi:MAG TPA: hypothetical protein VHT75_19590 [Acidimicrobiales bacterium]|nr:hypothetical protein [Acidimicrobiales bacterium]
MSLKDDPRAYQYIVDHLAPGTTISRHVEITNNTPSPQEVQLYAAAATIAGGSFLFGAGQAANALTGWTTVSPPSVRLAPGTSSTATVTIAVPANADVGEQYAVVWAQLAAAVPSGGGVTSVNRVGVRMYLSVGTGTAPVTQFSITALQARRAADGSSLVVATVNNTGGRAIDVSGSMLMTNGPGGLSAGPFSAQLGTTLGLGQVEPVEVPLSAAIPRGPWNAQMTLTSGATTVTASATITFPEAGATAAAPVKTASASHGSGQMPLIVGAGVLVLLLVLGAFGWARRRGRRRRAAVVESPEVAELVGPSVR